MLERLRQRIREAVLEELRPETPRWNDVCRDLGDVLAAMGR